MDLQQGGNPVFPRRCGFSFGEAGLKSQPLSSEVLLVLVGTQPGCGFVCNHRASPQRMHWVFCFLLWAGAGLGVLCASEGAGGAVPGLDGDGNGVPALGQSRYNQQSLGEFAGTMPRGLNLCGSASWLVCPGFELDVWEGKAQTGHAASACGSAPLHPCPLATAARRARMGLGSAKPAGLRKD